MAVIPLHEINNAQQRLHDAAVRLFAVKGYNATSIREIIETAGVTRPVLYYYFENKEALFTALVERQFEDACDELDQIAASQPSCRKRLTLVAQRAFEGAQRSPDIVRLLLHFFFSPPIPGIKLDKDSLGQRRFDRIVAMMRDGIASGELTARDPEELALVFMGVIDVQVMAWITRPDIPLSNHLAEELVELFLNGAAPNQDRD